MAAERRSGPNSGRLALDWNEAFLFYAALPPERRDYAAIAAEFGVSTRTVERHGREERWRERAREIDREAAAVAAAGLAQKRAEKLGDFERLVEASLLGYAQSLREGKVRLSPADLPRMYKLLQELWQGPAEVQTNEQSLQPLARAQAESLEHKLEVLRALREARVLEQLEQPHEREHDREPDPAGDRDDGSEGSWPAQPRGS